MADNIIYLGDDRFNAAWLKTVTESMAVHALKGHKPDQVRNAWKQANGFSKPKYDSRKKPSKKKVEEKKSED